MTQAAATARAQRPPLGRPVRVAARRVFLALVVLGSVAGGPPLWRYLGQCPTAVFDRERRYFPQHSTAISATETAFDAALSSLPARSCEFVYVCEVPVPAVLFFTEQDLPEYARLADDLSAALEESAEYAIPLSTITSLRATTPKVLPWSGDKIENAIELFAVRSQCRRLLRGDLPGAAEDVTCMLWLLRCNAAGQQRRWYLYDNSRWAALDTLVAYVADERVAAQHLDEIAAQLQDWRDPVEHWNSFHAAAGAMGQHFIDASFSAGPAGHLVLSHQPQWKDWTPARRSMLWNLAAPLYCSRGEVQDRWDDYLRACSVPDIASLQRLVQRGSDPFGILAGGLLHDLGNTAAYRLLEQLRTTLRVTARLRLVRAWVALHRYERALGRLPDALDQLVPDYLPAVPRDPFCERPIHMTFGPNGRPRVYSCNVDGCDQGGDTSRYDLIEPRDLRRCANCKPGD